MTQTVAVRSLAEMDAFAEKILGLLPRLAPSGRASLMTLSGELGAGKTAFAKSFAQALGVSEGVTSPTFVIEKIYALAGKPWKHLIHIDAYRLDSGRELLALGFAELLRKPENIILIEWPERVPEAFSDKPALALSFVFIDAATREISFDAGSISKNHA